MNNMELWDQVCQTNPDNTKKVDFGRRFTAIDAYSQIQTATTLWGPIGYKWGVKDESFTMLDNNLILYTATLFYPIDNTTYNLPIHSSITYRSINKNGKEIIDSDCSKKVSTDALTKGLSKLGFNADVFLGKFDDNKYIKEAKKVFNNKASEKQQTNTNEPTVNEKQNTTNEVNTLKEKLNILLNDCNYTQEEKMDFWEWHFKRINKSPTKISVPIMKDLIDNFKDLHLLYQNEKFKI